MPTRKKATVEPKKRAKMSAERPATPHPSKRLLQLMNRDDGAGWDYLPMPALARILMAVAEAQGKKFPELRHLTPQEAAMIHVCMDVGFAELFGRTREAQLWLHANDLPADVAGDLLREVTRLAARG